MVFIFRLSASSSFVVRFVVAGLDLKSRNDVWRGGRWRGAGGEVRAMMVTVVAF